MPSVEGVTLTSIARIFIPATDLTIETPLKLEDAVRSISEKIYVPTGFWDRILHGTDGKPFTGTVAGLNFEIRRLIGYRNSFLPTLHGKFVEGDPVRLEVRMRLQPVVIVFSVIWLGFVFLFLFPAALAFFRQPEKNLPMILIPLGMILFFVVMANAAFRFEVRKARDFLFGCLKAG
jgi:hypothetical protein